ncbi:uncharacterized protein LOC120534695 [Polypterus senegalus]|uniref:uncharacterized protein LOC120534695 n=1 Tax=Polypterus senegalus TaxID=55291 RepID=UPI0019663750|nr:uncharacterized protein LOC120534695 [Polypterus senegalus]
MALSKASDSYIQEANEDYEKTFNDLWGKAHETALLLNITYLHLGSFPQFETVIRRSAVKTLEAFSESSALLLKCVFTGDNIKNFLFPVLVQAANCHDDKMIKNVLQKIDKWIDSVMVEVEDVKKRIEKVKEDVNNDQHIIKNERSQRSQYQLQFREKQDEISQYEQRANRLKQSIRNLENQLADVNRQKQNLISMIQRSNRRVFINLSLLPWWGRWKFIKQDCDNSIRVHQQEIDRLNEQHCRIQNELQHQKEELASKEYAVFSMKLERIHLCQKAGTAAEGDCLTHIIDHLSKIEMNLTSVKDFWRNAKIFFEGYAQRIESLDMTSSCLMDYQKTFLDSVKNAEQQWDKFSHCCRKTKNRFEENLQNVFYFTGQDVKRLSEKERQDSIRKLEQQLSWNSLKQIAYS